MGLEAWNPVRDHVRGRLTRTMAAVGFDGQLVDNLCSRGMCNRGALFVMIATHGSGEATGSQLDAAVGIELVHRASVIRDDVQDDDMWRRGRPTLHAELGIPEALAISDIQLTLGQAMLYSAIPAAGTEVLAVLQNMALGQYMDICGPMPAFAESPFTLAELKTGSLIGGIFSWAASAAGVDQHSLVMYDCGSDLGTAFQLLNDVRNAEGLEDRGRGAGSDLTLGRHSSVALLIREKAASPTFMQELDMDRARTDAIAEVRDEAGRRLSRVSGRISALRGELPPELIDLIASPELARAFVADQHPAG